MVFPLVKRIRREEGLLSPECGRAMCFLAPSGGKAASRED